MKRTVNLKAVLVIAAVAASLAVGAHLVHGFQVKRNAHGLFERALQAEREGEPAQAVEHLERYLGLAPDDKDARARYGLLLFNQARNRAARLRAFLVLEDVLRRDPRRADVRRPAAELSVQFGRFSEARESLEALLRESPTDADLARLRGLCELGAQDPAQAIEWLTRAARWAPQRVGLSVEVATLLRDRLGQPEMAGDVIELLVQASPHSLPARSAAAHFYQRAGDREKAERQVRAALAEFPDGDADLLALAADLAMARGQLDEARRHLDRGRKLYPLDGRMGLRLARLEFQDRRREQALELLRPGRKEPPRQPEEVWNLAVLLLEMDELDGVEGLIGRLADSGAASAAGCLRGRLLMRQGAWGPARALLEGVRSAGLPLPELVLQANLWLGECYGRLGHNDQEEAAFRRALEADPQSLAARRGLAKSLAALGKLDQAIEEYRGMVARAPESRTELARLLLARNLRLPAAERKWGEVEQLLRDAPGDGQPSAALTLLRAEVLLAQNQADAARRLVEVERDRDPKQVAPWLLLVGLAERQGPPDAVPTLLAEAERRAGPRIEWESARARHWLKAAPAEAAGKLREIEAGLGRFPDADRNRLMTELAQSYLALGDQPAAVRLLRQVADREPGNLAVRFVLFETHFLAREEADAGRLLGEIRRLEGENGPVGTFAEAACQLFAARRGDRQALASARRLLERAAELSPTWSRVPLLQAETYELENNADKALEKYRAALDRGEGRLPVVRRVLQLLYAQHRYAEANDLVRKIPRQALTQTDLGRQAVRLWLTSPEWDSGLDPAESHKRALELARQSVPADSKDYRDHLWLGQVAAVAGRLDEAEHSLRRARDLAETAPEPWIALVALLAKTDAKKAEAELETARTRLPKEVAPLVLAACYEGLDHPQQAEEQYQAALAARPNDPQVLRGAANFYAGIGQPARAAPLLGKLIDPATKAPEPTVAWARRTLALTMPTLGSYSQFKEAVALLDANGAATPEDRLAKAVVLGMQPVHRREAIHLFEGLGARPGSVPPDAQLLLAQLYEADGNWPRAHALMLALVTEHEKNPLYQARFVRALLRQNAAEEARPWVDRLAALAPDVPETLDLRVRVLKATGRPAEAAALVNAYATGKDAQFDFAAALFELLEQPADAERMYRAGVARNQRPDSALLLAHFFARQKRLPEALGLWEQACQTGPVDLAARSGVLILRLGRGGAEQCERVERWLTAAIARDPRNPIPAVFLAELHDHRGRHEEAIALYRQLLRINARSVFVLNNLAYLLALKEGNTAEALQLVNAAIDTAGPFPTLLDTRAVVHLKANQADQAVKDLEQALALAPEPAFHFHLAQARLMARDRRGAARALEKAAQAGLKADDLHPLEQAAYRELSRELE
jgi:tetratricopeptide (TPR) repeat protein